VQATNYDCLAATLAEPAAPVSLTFLPGNLTQIEGDHNVTDLFYTNMTDKDSLHAAGLFYTNIT
jgi:hypothetical protein